MKPSVLSLVLLKEDQFGRYSSALCSLKYNIVQPARKGAMNENRFRSEQNISQLSRPILTIGRIPCLVAVVVTAHDEHPENRITSAEPLYWNLRGSMSRRWRDEARDSWHAACQDPGSVTDRTSRSSSPASSLTCLAN